MNKRKRTFLVTVTELDDQPGTEPDPLGVECQQPPPLQTRQPWWLTPEQQRLQRKAARKRAKQQAKAKQKAKEQSDNASGDS